MVKRLNTRYERAHGTRKRHRKRHFGVVFIMSILVFAGVAGYIIMDLKRSKSGSVEGRTNTVMQAADSMPDVLAINEPTFSMELPSDWKEVARQNDKFEHSISYQATKKDAENRYLKVYVDTIPVKKSINRLLPVVAQNNMLTIGDVSDNCATFTHGGTKDTGKAQALEDKPAKWSGVDFICDLARITDNEIGASSTDGLNFVNIKGQQSGIHKYYFLYTDRNIQPDSTIFKNALLSFKAK